MEVGSLIVVSFRCVRDHGSWGETVRAPSPAALRAATLGSSPRAALSRRGGRGGESPGLLPSMSCRQLAWRAERAGARRDGRAKVGKACNEACGAG